MPDPVWLIHVCLIPVCLIPVCLIHVCLIPVWPDSYLTDFCLHDSCLPDSCLNNICLPPIFSLLVQYIVRFLATRVYYPVVQHLSTDLFRPHSCLLSLTPALLNSSRMQDLCLLSDSCLLSASLKLYLICVPSAACLSLPLPPFLYVALYYSCLFSDSFSFYYAGPLFSCNSCQLPLSPT